MILDVNKGTIVTRGITGASISSFHFTNSASLLSIFSAQPSGLVMGGVPFVALGPDTSRPDYPGK